MGNGNAAEQVGLRLSFVLLTPHGEREPQILSMPRENLAAS